MVSDRYDRGFEKLKEIDGKAGERVIEGLKNLSLTSTKRIFLDETEYTRSFQSFMRMC
jgi:hypothetical protein